MRYLFCWPTAYIYSLFVIAISVVPIQQPPQLEGFFLDKVIHGFMYWLLAFLVVNTLSPSRVKQFFFIGFFYAFGLGCLTEFIQLFLPYRSFEAADLLVNAFGSLAGSWLRVR